jgi:hypothetical protein
MGLEEITPVKYHVWKEVEPDTFEYLCDYRMFWSRTPAGNLGHAIHAHLLGTPKNTNVLLPKFHQGGIFSRGSTGISPHLDHTPWYCPPEGGVWIPLVVVLQVEYSTKKLPRQRAGNSTKIPLMLRLQETNSCVHAIQSRLIIRAADTTKSDNPPWRHRNRLRRSLSKMSEKKRLCIMDHLHPIVYRYVKK